MLLDKRNRSKYLCKSDKKNILKYRSFSAHQGAHVESSMSDHSLNLPLNVLSFRVGADVVVAQLRGEARYVPRSHTRSAIPKFTIWFYFYKQHRYLIRILC